MLKTILIIILVLILLGYGGMIGEGVHAILNTVKGMSITTILVIILIIILIRK